MITTRANLTRKIVSAIHKDSKDCNLHILGCGNLLSFSLLAVAGAMMCDGLEWCRTFAAENFHLHHFQHKDIFADPGLYVGNPLVEAVIKEVQDDYATAVAVRNLLSFQFFTRHLHSLLAKKKVHEFVSENFGGVAEVALSESLGTEMKIYSPLRDLTKREVVQLAHEKGISSYYSCHSGTKKPCGKCIACLEYK